MSAAATERGGDRGVRRPPRRGAGTGRRDPRQRELGSGKTTLIRGACRALGVEGAVVSPTFTIGRRYEGRVPISHLDLYRVEDLGLEDPALLDDYLTPDAIAFVEWPGSVRDAPLANGVRVVRRVELRHAGGDRREIVVGPVA